MGHGVKEAVALLNPHCNEREDGQSQVSAGCCAASLSASPETLPSKQEKPDLAFA